MALSNKKYFKNSGPGWIQAAVTLGGGTLVSSLYLGVIGGYDFLWLQPLAMLCGIIMLGALNYITLSQDEPKKNRPFILTKNHVSNTLAWGWLVGAVVANIVFCASQFALGTDAIQGNLGWDVSSPYIITFILFIVALVLIWLFSAEGKLSEWVNNVIKVLVATVVISFMIVVVVLGMKGGIEWGAFFKGWIPDFSLLFNPSESYSSFIADTGAYSDFWKGYIADNQRNIIIGAFGTAVGINMTFLLPYALMKKNWKRSDRKWSQYDLMFGLFIPFVLGATCLVLSTATQFHAKKNAVISEKAYNDVLDKRLEAEHGEYIHQNSKEYLDELRNNVGLADKNLSIMLAKRSATELATALEPFLGKHVQLIFGIGILAMAISTMLIHMMINGYALSEAFGHYGSRKWFLIGATIPALSGLFSPFIWAGSVKAAIVVPASVIATMFLPIAYLIFILLMNSKKAMNDQMVRRRLLWNVLMIFATGIASFASVWALIGKINSANPYENMLGLVGLIALSTLLVFGLYQFWQKERKVLS